MTDRHLAGQVSYLPVHAWVAAGNTCRCRSVIQRGGWMFVTEPVWKLTRNRGSVLMYCCKPVLYVSVLRIGTRACCWEHVMGHEVHRAEHGQLVSCMWLQACMSGTVCVCGNDCMSIEVFIHTWISDNSCQCASLGFNYLHLGCPSEFL